MPNPPLTTVRTDRTVLPTSSDPMKSIVSRPMPLSFEAFGSLVASRRLNAGRPSCSLSTCTFVATTKSSTSEVESPVAVTIDASGAGCRSVIVRRL